MRTISLEGTLRFPAASSPAGLQHVPVGSEGHAVDPEGPARSRSLRDARSLAEDLHRGLRPRAVALTEPRTPRPRARPAARGSPDVDDRLRRERSERSRSRPRRPRSPRTRRCRERDRGRRAAARSGPRRSARRRGTARYDGEVGRVDGRPRERDVRPVDPRDEAGRRRRRRRVAVRHGDARRGRDRCSPRGPSPPPAARARRGAAPPRRRAADRASSPTEARSGPRRRPPSRRRRGPALEPDRGDVEVRRLGHDAHRVAEAGPVRRVHDDGVRGAIVERLADLVRRHRTRSRPRPSRPRGSSARRRGARGPRRRSRARGSPSGRRARPRWSWRGARCGRRGCRRRRPRGSAARTGRASRRAPCPFATATRTGGSGGSVSTTTRRVTRASLPFVSSASRARTYGPSTSASHSPSVPAATGTDERRSSVHDGRGSRPLRRTAGTPRSRRRCRPCRERRRRPRPRASAAGSGERDEGRREVDEHQRASRAGSGCPPCPRPGRGTCTAPPRRSPSSHAGLPRRSALHVSFGRSMR